MCIISDMQHIRMHLGPSSRRDRASERGDLMQYFMQKLNVSRTRDGLAPLTMGRMGRVLQGIPTKDLYFLKSVCDDAQKRNGIDAFSKRFWWEINPKKHEGDSTEQKPKGKPGLKVQEVGMETPFKPMKRARRSLEPNWDKELH
ncbi:MAG: hypothetical protein QG621_567 [Patescibacteria group bacterium]|nr:hypothetical protein [Patescibacteria group bacterium]